MLFYYGVLFLHISGALGLFIGIGIEWMIISRLSKITNKTFAIEWISSFKILRKVFAISAILLLLSGIYLSVNTWGMSAWVDMGLILFILLALFGSIIVARKAGSVMSALESEEESLSDKIRTQINDPILTQSLKIRTSLALSIIFIMTIKPDWQGTLESVGIFLLVGIILTLKK